MAIRRRNTGDYLDGVLSELLKHAPRALDQGRPLSVHRARVATRRLGAGLKILQPLLPQQDLQPFRKALKRIRRSLGELRDLDVMQEHLGELPARHKVAAVRVAGEFHSRRNLLSQELRGDDKVHAAIGAAREWSRPMQTVDPDAVTPLLQLSIAQQFADFAQRADELALALRHPDSQQAQPHALRIAGKSLRYALEMASVESLPVADVVQRYKAMQDALGLWHDHHVLAQEVMKFALKESRQPTYRPDEDEMILLAADITRSGKSCLQQFGRLWTKGRGRLTSAITQVTAKEAV